MLYQVFLFFYIYGIMRESNSGKLIHSIQDKSSRTLEDNIGIFFPNIS